MKTPQHLLEYQKQYRKSNRDLISKKSKLKRQRRLLEAITLLGGRCEHCGGVFDSICYDFHHIDPKTKIFTISEHMDIGIEKFLIEVRKCQLLCANCHRLIHKQGTYDNREV